MKFLVKLAVVVLVVGGILFAAGIAMGGSVYTAWYGGALHPFHEVFRIGWGEAQDEVREVLDETQHEVRDALRDAQDEVRGALDGHHD